MKVGGETGGEDTRKRTSLWLRDLGSGLAAAMSGCGMLCRSLTPLMV